MKNHFKKYPLVWLPKKSEQVIALLREELKANFFFNHLAKVGLDDSLHRPCLGSVILDLMGFTSNSDEVMNFYVKRLEHYTAKLKPNKGQQHFTKKALHFYSELRKMKKEKN